jgi:demethoxyubiquinone hydroxylase (CLK1/Coq7/Cat5 family)
MLSTPLLRLRAAAALARAAAPRHFVEGPMLWAHRAASTSSGDNDDAKQQQQQSPPTPSALRPPPPALDSVLRQAQVAEAAAAAFMRGQALALGGRPDAAHLADDEDRRRRAVDAAARRHGARPSALLGAARLAGAAVGFWSALVAPRPLRLVVAGAVQDAVSDAGTDGLRSLLEAQAAAEEEEQEAEEQRQRQQQQQQGQGHAAGRAGASATAATTTTTSSSSPSRYAPADLAPDDVRAVLREVRDADRAPHGAPSPPDLAALLQAKSLADLGGAEAALGAAVKAAAAAALRAAAKV